MGNNIGTRLLAHLGIVAGYVDKLGLVEFLDAELPKEKGHHVSSGQAAKAIILNGLGFVERRLYLFPEYFENLPTERLLGRGTLPEHLNDDVLGRTLGALGKAGISALYGRFVEQCLSRILPPSLVLHSDTTNFSVSGAYEPDEGQTWTMAFGHAKDGRNDLKRFVLNLVSSGEGIPLFLEVLSGNASDKKSLVAGIERATKTLASLSTAPICAVADSTFYTAENIGRLRGAWISRVPATIGEAQEFIGTDEAFTPCTDERYAFMEKGSSYGNVPQRWILFRSRDMAEKEERTLEKRTVQALTDAQKDFSKLSRIEFFCEADARSALSRYFEDHPLVWGDPLIEERRRKKRSGKGRPVSGEEMETWYSVQGDLALRPDAVEKLRHKLGRFILATTDTTLSPEQILDRYKEQGAVERGFRFLKDPSFRTTEVYLKNEERIEGLLFLMVLALLVYNLAEKDLRPFLCRPEKAFPARRKSRHRIQRSDGSFSSLPASPR